MLLAGGFAIYRGKPMAPGRDQEIILVSERLLSEALLNGRKAVFCAPAETVVEAYPDGRVRVTGWLDLFGPEGKPERQSFSIVVYRDSARKWVCEAPSMAPQM